MAKKKVINNTEFQAQTSEVKSDENSTAMRFDLQLLTHKYSDYYTAKDESAKESYVWYDTKEVYCPVYKTKVFYQTTTIQPLHPVIIEILKAIKYLQTLKGINIYEKLKAITQLDDEIYVSIIADLVLKGLLKQEDCSLTDNGKEALQKAKEKLIKDETAFVAIDAVCNQVLDAAKNHKDIFLKNKTTKEGLEIKSNFNARPRTEKLYDEFSDNKTLYQILREALQLCNDKEQEAEVSNITEVADVKKFYTKYLCLFYKNANEDEKILALDERYEIDNEATKLLDKLVEEHNLTPRNDESSSYKEHIEKKEALTPQIIEQKQSQMPDLSEGAIIEVSEHKRYFFYVLQNAKKHIYIQSPWVREDVLSKYKDEMQKALQRGVKICIKYGLKPRGKFDKAGIDEKSKDIFKNFAKNYPQIFSLKKDDDHSKILICDEEFMIIGSFNWLSFGGEMKNNEKIRKESSTINKNSKEIQNKIQEFEKAAKEL